MEKAHAVSAPRLELSGPSERLAHSQGSTEFCLTPVPGATRTVTEATGGKRQDFPLPAV